MLRLIDVIIKDVIWIIIRIYIVCMYPLTLEEIDRVCGFQYVNIGEGYPIKNKGINDLKSQFYLSLVGMHTI